MFDKVAKDVVDSAMEGFNGTVGYDLLAVENVTKKLEDLPRVEPREGANG